MKDNEKMFSDFILLLIDYEIEFQTIKENDYIDEYTLYFVLENDEILITKSNFKITSNNSLYTYNEIIEMIKDR